MASTLAESDEDAAKTAQAQAAIDEERVGSSKYQQTHMAMIFQDGLSFSGFERNKVFFGRGDGTYLDLSDVSGADDEGDCRAVVAADFDDDGDVDFFTNAIQHECHMLFRNDTTAGNRGFVKLRLRAAKGHPDAIGAIVKVKVGDRWQARVLSCGSGFESQTAPELVFGLGDADSAEVRVRWPGRAEESFGTVSAKSRSLLVEGTGEPEPYEARTFAFGRVRPRGLRIAEGETLPQLELLDLDGNDAALAASATKPRLVNFWQTTCMPCIGELPLFQKLKSEGKYDVVAVSLDRPDRAGRIRDIWKRLELDLDVRIISEKTAERLFDLDRLAIPVTFVVSPEGTIERVIQGKLEREDLK